jgi:hypothetical protein
MTNETVDASGTSFYGTTIKATVRELLDVLGEPDYDANDGIDKTNYDWARRASGGEVFTVYDWKYYRPLRGNERVEWHIGGRNLPATEAAKSELLELLNRKRA